MPVFGAGDRRTTAQLTSAVTAGLLALGALTAGAGAAHAEPDAQPQQNIRYSAKLVDRTVVTTLKGGTFTLSKAHERDLSAGLDTRLTQHDGAVFEADGKPADIADVIDVADVRDETGRTVATLPLNFRLAGITIPVAAVVRDDATVLELTPQRPTGLDVSRPVAVSAAATVPTARVIASDSENQKAMADFSTKFGLATGIGSFVGTAVGATIGCVVTIAAGCVTGLATGAGIGGVVGTVATGGPTLIASGLDLINTLDSADGTSKYATTATPEVTVQPAPADTPR
ncbi:hypothetical protein [Nocardia sp. alder85J]|uniref:hypothetical protein n=1 Tax=Nocardia sp. alder85J TaxID=2862949 RepID=UPI001CD1F369|nr:hypothetical protein [Nocardia sp. alder85J]MCX4095883.1 hypothetical protein [Nocardia sp. alder85J]